MRKRLKFLPLVMMMCLPMEASAFDFGEYAQVSKIKDIRTSYNAEKTRVIIESSKKLDFSYFFLSSPNRLVIDIDNSTGFDHEALVDKNSPVVRDVRTGVHGDQTRVVIDLSDEVAIMDQFQLLPTGGDEFRLVFDVKPKTKSQVDLIRSIAEKAAKKASSKAVASGSQQVEKTSVVANRDTIIVIDAGHGGKDPGAIGVGGLKEKDVVLAIAKKLAAKIDRQPGMKAILTRDSDVYLKLRERSDVARRHKADFLISIHADAFVRESPSGPSVFALSNKGATSETAVWLQKRENSEPLNAMGEELDLSTKDDVLAGVLLDLSLRGTIKQSLAAGESVISQMSKVAKPHKPTVQQAAFMVLRSPDIPSLLVETGFLTNRKDAKNLSTSAYQDKMADSIYSGMMTYFTDKLPAYAQKR